MADDGLTLADLLEPGADPAPSPGDSPDRARWLRDGHVVKADFLPHDLADAYAVVRERADGWEGGVTPYMEVPELLALCTCGPLAALLEDLVGEPAGVHLNLCGWVSTERDWHADSYLNPPHVGGRYAAVWFALEDIRPECGPFEFVPGSHRRGRLDQGKVIDAMLARGLTTPGRVASGRWPWDSERLLTPLFDAERAAGRVGEPETFLARKYDVLVWHPDLWHRGSPPAVPGTPRRALIAHYSGVRHRPDMPAAERAPGGGWYFPIHSTVRH